MTNTAYALVMAGGRGTRFWPESTNHNPKQYLQLFGSSPLLTQTLLRMEGLIEAKNRFIVTVEDQKEQALSSAGKEIGTDNVILEPTGRNTAPCILLSLAQLVAKGASEDDLVAIVPSDHVILNQEAFRSDIKAAFKLAQEKKKIVTIGIFPNFPHTGYGYIKRGADVSDNSYNVEQFKEKPDYDTACAYVKSGGYFWNAGMFVSTIGVLISEFEKCAPEIFASYKDLTVSAGNFDKTSSIYFNIPKESIDYAVMEKSSEVLVHKASFDWNDLGSWDALESVVEKVDGNSFARSAGHYAQNSTGNIVYAPNKFVSLINVDNLIVVSNEKVLMVLPKSDSQQVKNVVEYLKSDPKGVELL